jgi:hypothetical protein
VYQAPATVWAQDVSRGWQLLPNDNVYKLPINGLSVDSRSSYWIQRVADQAACPGTGCIATYHNFKLIQPGKLNFYDNVIDNSTPTQLFHSYYGGNSGPYQNTSFPILQPPNVSMQNGWSQDQAAPLDRHLFMVNWQTGAESELYIPVVDFQTAVITPGNPTSIAYTTRAVRVVENPLRVYISGITGGCSVLNGNYMATVVSQVPGTSGVLSVPVNTTGLTCTSGTPSVANEVDKCQLCNVRSTMWWFPASNAIVGGVDAAGSPLSATSIHTEEWWNVVQQNILDPACNCVTLGHAIRTTLANSDISMRNLWPAVLGNEVSGGHPPIMLSGVVTGNPTTFTTAAPINGYLPCSGYTYAPGCTFHNVIGTYAGTWAAANGNWVATAVDNTHFTIPLNSTGFPSLPPGIGFVFDWLPYGSHIRLKASFNVNEFCSNNSLTDKCPYEKAILNTLQVYGLVLLDGTLPSDNWDSGIVSSEFDPTQLTDATNDLKSNPAFQSIEQYLEVANVSGQQIDFTPFTNPRNQIGLTANNRVTVTVTCGGCIRASIDVQLQGTAVGTDRERISMVAGTTYQINSWVTGNVDNGVTYSMSPTVPGASVSGSGVLTAPSSLSAMTQTMVTISSVADSTANAYVDVYFIPVSGDRSIRVNFGQHATSYTDHLGNIWWGNFNGGWQSTYELADGVAFAELLGTWTTNRSSWSGTTDAQLYAQSTVGANDTNLAIVVPNGNYNLTLFGEPGYGVTAAGQNVYDVEINGNVVSSYNDGFLLAGSRQFHGYTTPYTATVSNGLLRFNARIRESSTYGMSLSSLLISPSGSH